MKIKQTPEEALERMIEDAMNRACDENLSIGDRRKSEELMRELIAKRTPEKVAKLETSRGLQSVRLRGRIH